jgi:sporulation protein YlmC with PRC-barrel domain
MGVSAVVLGRMREEHERTGELVGRVSTRGVLDRLALVRGPRTRSARAARGSTGRVWQLELGLQFDPCELGEYWIGRCHGFLVDTTAGDPVGVVDDVRVNEETGAVAALDVSSPSGLFRRRRFLLAVESVRAILPLEKRLLVEPAEEGGQLSSLHRGSTG